MSRVYAVRGATTVTDDSREAIVAGTQALLTALVERNEIDRADIVSAFFTATDDLQAEFPAAAARLMGWNGVPLLCARELAVTSALAMPRCIRVLLHHYADHPPEPVYLEGTDRLQQPPDPV